MFLRWMVRSNKKGVDFGIWKSISTSDLSLPLDVHTGNVARKLCLLKRKQNDAKALLELDTNLRNLRCQLQFILFAYLWQQIRVCRNGCSLSQSRCCCHSRLGDREGVSKFRQCACKYCNNLFVRRIDSTSPPKEARRKVALLHPKLMLIFYKDEQYYYFLRCFCSLLWTY